MLSELMLFCSTASPWTIPTANVEDLRSILSAGVTSIRLLRLPQKPRLPQVPRSPLLRFAGLLPSAAASRACRRAALRSAPLGSTSVCRRCQDTNASFKAAQSCPSISSPQRRPAFEHLLCASVAERMNNVISVSPNTRDSWTSESDDRGAWMTWCSGARMLVM